MFHSVRLCCYVFCARKVCSSESLSWIASIRGKAYFDRHCTSQHTLMFYPYLCTLNILAEPLFSLCRQAMVWMDRSGRVCIHCLELGSLRHSAPNHDESIADQAAAILDPNNKFPAFQLLMLDLVVSSIKVVRVTHDWLKNTWHFANQL